MKVRAIIAAACVALFTLACDGDAELQVTPLELNYGTIAGDAHMKITVKNTGDEGFFINEADLEYTPVGSEDWMSLPLGGTLPPGGEEMIDLWVYRDDLDVGINSGWVDFTSNGGEASVKVLVWRAADPLPGE